MLTLLCSTMSASSNTLKRSCLTLAEVPIQCFHLSVQILSQTSFTKKGVTTQRVYKVMISDEFELGGEGEMEPTSSGIFSTSLRIT